MASREEALTFSLKEWATLPINDRARQSAAAALRKSLLTTAELPTLERALLTELLGGADDGVAPSTVHTAPDDDLGRMLALLVRGHRASIEAGALRRSDAAATAGAELNALATSSLLVAEAGLSTPMRTQAIAWLVAHDGGGLSPSTLSIIHRLFEFDPDTAVPAAYATVFTALSESVVDAGRADLWLEIVSRYLDGVAPRARGELSALIAQMSVDIIERDSRWFRAHRVLEQSLSLLEIARSRGSDAQLADAIAIELGIAFVHNRDLDERPLLLDIDETVKLISDSVANESRGQVVAHFADVAARLCTEPESVRGYVTHWWREIGAQSEDFDSEQIVNELLMQLELMRDSDDEPGFEQDDVEPQSRETGVPEGLYSAIASHRLEAMQWIRSSWAFSAAGENDEQAWPAAYAILAEGYARGISDPDERLRERAVIFARRIIFWNYSRDHEEVVRWAERVVGDTDTLTTPRAVRARCLALFDIEQYSVDPGKVTKAASRLDRELEGNYADYAIVLRATSFRWRIDNHLPTEQLIPLFERCVQLELEAELHDEYEQKDWNERLRSYASWLFIEYQARKNWDDAVRNAELYISRLPDHQAPGVDDFLAVRIIKDLAAHQVRFDTVLSVRADTVVDAADTWLAEHNPLILRDARAQGAARRAGFVWEKDRTEAMAQFESACAEMRAIVNEGEDTDGEILSLLIDWARYAFLEAERWECGEIDGEVRPYDLTTIGASLYLRTGCASDDPANNRLVPSMIKMAASPKTFLTGTDASLVHELYQLLQEQIDPARDADYLTNFRACSARAQAASTEGGQGKSKQTFGWFRRGRK